MAGVCVTCTSPHQAAIEASIASGQNLSVVGRKFSMNRDALRRHRDRHMSRAITALRAEQGAAVQIEATARDRVEGLVAKLEALVNRTHDERRESMLLGASRELRASIELLARLSGELRPENQTTVQVLNLSTSGEWVATRQAILDALMPFPDAQVAVASRLRLLSDGGDT